MSESEQSDIYNHPNANLKPVEGETEFIKGLKALSKILRELGLPSSPKTLRSYEKSGVIKAPKNPKGIRIYSQEDVNNIIREVAGKSVSA